MQQLFALAFAALAHGSAPKTVGSRPFQAHSSKFAAAGLFVTSGHTPFEWLQGQALALHECPAARASEKRPSTFREIQDARFILPIVTPDCSN
jgi:hypothetical protein